MDSSSRNADKSYTMESFMEKINLKDIRGSDFAEIKQMIAGNLFLTNFRDMNNEMWRSMALLFPNLRVGFVLDENERTAWIYELGSVDYIYPNHILDFSNPRDGLFIPTEFSSIIIKTNDKFYDFSRPEHQLFFDCFKLKVIQPNWNSDVIYSGCLRKAMFDMYRVDIGDIDRVELISPLKLSQIKTMDEGFRELNYTPQVIVSKSQSLVKEFNMKSKKLERYAHIQPYSAFNLNLETNQKISALGLLEDAVNEWSSYADVTWRGSIYEKTSNWNCKCQAKGDFFFRRHFKCHFVTGKFKCPGCHEEDGNCTMCDGEEISNDTNSMIGSAVQSSQGISLATSLSAADSVSSFLDHKVSSLYDKKSITVDCKIEPHIPLADDDKEIVTIDIINMLKKIIKIKSSCLDLLDESFSCSEIDEITSIYNCSLYAEKFVTSIFKSLLQFRNHSYVDNIEFMKFRYRNDRIDIQKPLDRNERTKLCDNIWYLITKNLDNRSVFNLAKSCRSLYWTPVCSCCDKMICDNILEQIAMNADIEDDMAYFSCYDM